MERLMTVIRFLCPPGPRRGRQAHAEGLTGGLLVLQAGFLTLNAQRQSPAIPGQQALLVCRKDKCCLIRVYLGQ